MGVVTWVDDRTESQSWNVGIWEFPLQNLSQMPHLLWPRNLQSWVLWLCMPHWLQHSVVLECSATFRWLARDCLGLLTWWTASSSVNFPACHRHHTYSSLRTLMSSWDVAWTFGSALSPFWMLMYGLMKLSQDGSKEEIMVILNWTSGILKLLSSTKLRCSQYFLRVVRWLLVDTIDIVGVTVELLAMMWGVDVDVSDGAGAWVL